MRSSTNDEIDHRVFGEQLYHGVVKGVEWKGFEILSFIYGCANLVKSNIVVHPPISELPYSHHLF